MIGAKHMDPVLGVDIHITMIPTPGGPIPTPLPYPFIGMVFDPMDLVPIIGATVWVNGMPAGVAGTGAKNLPPHIPMGGPFGPPPPGNEGEIFMGSATVLCDGEPFSYTALPVISCSSVGSPAPPRMKKGGAKSLMLPTSLVLSVPMGMPVLVGGPPTISLMGMAMKFGMAALGKLGKKFRKMQKNSDFWKNISKKLNKKADDIMGEAGALRNKVRKGICFVTGHPVDIPTGKVFTDQIDFELPGPIPLVWERTWYSTSRHEGPLGHGWHHAYDSALILHEEEGYLMLRQSDGRLTVFPTLEPGERTYNRQDKLTLSRDEEGYCLQNEKYYYHRFEESGREWSLREIHNSSGHNIRFERDEWGALTRIIDSGDRHLIVETDAYNRITAILGPHPEKEGDTFPLIRYAYSEEGDLVQTRDALGHEASYRYENHLLVQETDRNGLSFYFEYDGYDHNARCVRTWGDDGIYDHKLTYAGGITFVENSLGHTTAYHHNGALVTKEVDPKGAEKHYEYNEHFETLAEIDALGRRTDYTYDEYGNRVMTNFPDSTLLQLQYDQHKLVNATDQNGGHWSWFYDDRDRLVLRQDCMGQTTSYGYSDQGDLTAVVDAEGAVTRLAYDNSHNLLQLTSPDNGTSRWKYDRLGRNRVSIDPKGNVQRRHFDLQGNVIQVDEPDGNHRYLDYDPEGNVIRSRDRHHDVGFSYQGMSRLRSRKENGTEVSFLYDTEEQLIGIRNEQNHLYRFDLDENGQVEIESGFDEVKRYYQRDELGRVTSVVRASGIETRYEYDKMDRVVEVQHVEDNRIVEVETYAYRPDGELLEATNAHSQVKFERDALGRVVKEWEGEHWIESTFDRRSMRTGLKSRLGADLNFQRNQMGDVKRVIAQLEQGPWEARFQHDLLGLETRRSFTGGVFSQWERDQLGRPMEQQVFTAGANRKAAKTRRYRWDVNDRLQALQIDEMEATRFGHDDFGNLAWAQYGSGDYEYRLPDEVGNLFKKQDRRDRKYGPAGQLLEAEGTRYHYDPEGNLISKVQPDGDTWYYRWYASGMMKSVERPDGQLVEFTYDPLGRRLSKAFAGRSTRWIWDGNVPLHEWQEEAGSSEPVVAMSQSDDLGIHFFEKGEDEGRDFLDLDLGGDSAAAVPQPADSPAWQSPTAQVVTWLFEPESFAPLAKIVDGKAFSIITDHLGTPVAMYDEAGHTAWAAETSIYGELRELQGPREACPFRYPGQYEDVETGLYYNRFRYYDPEGGQYVSQDPIGLAGNNPTLYGYTSDVNFEIDPSGLTCYYNKPKKKVNTGNVGDRFRSPTSHPDDFVKKGKNYTNTNTGEIWQRSHTQHSGGLEWKVGRKKGVEPRKSSKVTLTDDGTIIKFDP